MPTYGTLYIDLTPDEGQCVTQIILFSEETAKIDLKVYIFIYSIDRYSILGLKADKSVVPSRDYAFIMLRVPFDNFLNDLISSLVSSLGL